MKGKIPKRHQDTKYCQRFQLRRIRLIQEKSQRQIQPLEIGGQHLDYVRVFKYLGRLMSWDNQDYPAIFYNINKFRMMWGRMKVILKTNFATHKVRAQFYIDVCQAVLLYGSDTWDGPLETYQNLRICHHQAARHLANLHIRPDLRDQGKWIIPRTDEVFKRENLERIEVYIKRRRRTLRKNL